MALPIRKLCRGIGAFACVSVLFFLPLVSALSAADKLERITIVDDKAYPPFVFIDNTGTARGILVDIYGLWSKKTGIPVDFRLMDWEAALNEVKEGRADALSATFRTPERERDFDFTSQIVTISTAIFFHHEIGGIKGLADLSGFRVGMVEGDSIEGKLRKQLPGINLVTYKGADAMVRDAVAGKLKVFVSDVPVARFYLAQNQGGENFRQTGYIQTLPLFSAVRKGNQGALVILQAGFDRISTSEIDAIVSEWSGRSAVLSIPWRQIGFAVGILIFLTTAFFISNLLLRRRIAIATQEITEKNRQLALSNELTLMNEKKFRTIFNNAPIGIFRTSLDGRILEANTTLVRMLGYDSDEALKSSVKDLATEIYGSPQERQRILDALIQSPQGVHMEIELRRRDGSPLYSFLNTSLSMDVNERPIYWDGTVEDITTRKQAEMELRRLGAAVEQSGEIIIITDPDGVIQYVNQEFEKITGYSRQEAIGRKPSLLKSGEHDLAFYTSLWQTISRGETWTGRFVNKRKDGSQYTEEAHISPIFNNERQIVNYVAAKRDITHELVLEEQYRQSQKMESIGQLAGGVAHDFNNMLTIVISHTEMAMIGLDPGDAISNHLKRIYDAALRSADLVRQLLAFARKQTITPKVLNINDTITGMLKILQRLIGEDIDLAWMPGQDTGKVRIDPTQINQILTNLMLNARDAIGGGVGKITIETDNVVLDDAYCSGHRGFLPGRYVLLAVSDSGCGMDKKTLAQIFDPFFTTKEVGQGTGLGLATVYGIVKQNDGFIHVYSEPGQGTTIKIYLPAIEMTEDHFTVKARVEGNLRGTETVLIVEDNREILNLGKSILQQLGYTVFTAGTPGQAIELARECNCKIDLLITDVVMPQMNGNQLAQRLGDSIPGLKCLYMSGYTKNIIAHRGVLDEGVNFLQKPFSIKELAAKVREIIEG
jgi:PAS domain S-box-containing protein